MERNWRLEAQMVAACKDPPTTPRREDWFYMELPPGVPVPSPLPMPSALSDTSLGSAQAAAS